MKTGKRIGYFGLSFLAFLGAIVVQVAAQLVVMLPSSIKAGFEAGKQGIKDIETINQMTMDAIQGVMPLAVLAAHVAMLLTFALWYYFGCGKPSLKNVNLKKVFAPKNLAAMLLISVGLCYFTNFGLSLIYPIIPESITEAYESLMESAQMGESPLAIIAAVCVAPIGEELIFRGVSFYYAKKAVTGMSKERLGFWIANCVQAFLFGVLHMNLLQGTYAFVLGLVLGYLADRYKSILPAMLGHFVFNSVSSFTMGPITNILPESNAVYAVVVVVCLVVMIAGFYLSTSKRAEAVSA